MSRFLVEITQDEDGVYVASCPGLPGCNSQGDSVEDAVDNIVDAIELYQEYLKDTDASNDATKERRFVDVPVTV